MVVIEKKSITKLKEEDEKLLGTCPKCGYHRWLGPEYVTTRVPISRNEYMAKMQANALSGLGNYIERHEEYLKYKCALCSHLQYLEPRDQRPSPNHSGVSIKDNVCESGTTGIRITGEPT